MNRLSSGKRINSAADDAAGLAIATRMRAKENGLGVASRNTQDGISLIRTADSALNSVSNILLRMRDLAVQSANGTNSGDDRAATEKEFKQLKDQIDYIADNTAFNGTTLLKTLLAKYPLKLMMMVEQLILILSLLALKTDLKDSANNTLDSLSVAQDTTAKAAITSIDDMIKASLQAVLILGLL